MRKWLLGQSVEMGFTTRDFPLVLKKTDELLLKSNQEKFFSLFPYDRVALLNQVHSDGIAVITDEISCKKKGVTHFEKCDAALTNVKGLALLVFTADCLPIFYTAGDWVALAHAGWRGTEKMIAKKTLKLLLERSGKKPEEVQVSFGPSIRQCHYEVGPEFRESFKAPSLVEKGGALYLDLIMENQRQLTESGLPERNITDLCICTIDQNKDFYSFRKEKTSAGRIISYIVITP